MSLSEHIKQKRKKNGLSQVELAERAGVGLRFVRDLEQGKQTLRMDKVNDVLALFGVQIIQFPHLIKPNFSRLCHYCATKNGIFCTKNEV